ncbi:hypothetical protein BT63DRAFT_458815 [Microthyrium microscopicum]|uniref:MARVEL domain-containing protein n=1 Tax=Microthyrium microscopicum TaxID=703497 RepID=A0A6A6U4T9_9PEZI|nr:hypothetical protein BT63DRAFT_458815 [Microthyrium microscopicum]
MNSTEGSKTVHATVQPIAPQAGEAITTRAATENAHPLRTNRAITAVRGAQIILTIAALGVSGGDISSWKSNECNAPAKLDYNIAVAAISLPALIYLLLNSGKLGAKFHSLPWHPFAQAGMDFVLPILWIAAAALWSTDFTCDQLCGLCKQFGFDNGGSDGFYLPSAIDPYESCVCFWTLNSKRGLDSGNHLTSRAVHVPSHSGSSAKSAKKAGKAASKLGIDWIMVIVSAIALGLTILNIIKARKAQQTQPAIQMEPKTEAQPVAQGGQQQPNHGQYGSPDGAPPGYQSPAPAYYPAPQEQYMQPNGSQMPQPAMSPPPQQFVGYPQPTMSPPPHQMAGYPQSSTSPHPQQIAGYPQPTTSPPPQQISGYPEPTTSPPPQQMAGFVPQPMGSSPQAMPYQSQPDVSGYAYPNNAVPQQHMQMPHQGVPIQQPVSQHQTQ